ncbi:MAG TPA: hypothetical protein VLA28_00235 [Afifellaceae bacterium]|nr:hypothetical protein [Afifellaceae bacterium]
MDNLPSGFSATLSARIGRLKRNGINRRRPDMMPRQASEFGSLRELAAACEVIRMPISSVPKFSSCLFLLQKT